MSLNVSMLKYFLISLLIVQLHLWSQMVLIRHLQLYARLHLVFYNVHEIVVNFLELIYKCFKMHLMLLHLFLPLENLFALLFRLVVDSTRSFTRMMVQQKPLILFWLDLKNFLHTFSGINQSIYLTSETV